MPEGGVMLIGNNETTKLIDNYAINNLGIPSIVLMENASISFMKHIDMSVKNYLVICGKGNNGGDGYAIARHLHSAGKNVNIFSLGNENLSKDCQVNYDICKNLNMKIFSDIKKLDSLLLECDAIIEGIFGTGLNSNIEGIYKTVIEKINGYSHNRTVYSIDIPSGIDGNSGEILGIAVKADKTVSFVTYKKAFLNIANKEFFGEISVEDIGFNIKNVYNLVNEYYLTEELIKEKIIGRKEDAHKGDFGKVLIFAGSREFSGAAAIVSETCVRTGAGLVTLMTYDNTFSGNISSSPESMILEIEHKNIENSFKKIEDIAINSDVITIGPGIGKSEKSLQIMKKLLQYKKNTKGETIKLVIDADGLNLLSENPELFKEIENRAVLTPHTMEFSRLSGFSLEEISDDKKEMVTFEVEMVNDEKNGNFVSYYPNGKKMEEGVYVDDKKEGKFTMYYSDGRLRETKNYIDGKKEGIWEYFDLYKYVVIKEEEYKNDKEISLKKYNDERDLIFHSYYEGGFYYEEKYNEKGKIISKKKYKEDRFGELIEVEEYN